MKKILALLLALIMMTSCAQEEPSTDSGIQSSTAEESFSSSENIPETSEGDSIGSSSFESHSSQQSGDPVSGESGGESGKTSSGSGISSETSSASESASSGFGGIIIPGSGSSAGESVDIEGSYVKRANARGNGGEPIIWSYAENEKNKEGDKPFIVFTDAKTLANFVSSIEASYQIGSGGGSLKEQLLSYDESFFEESALILTHIRSGSGSVRYEVKGVFVNGSECVLAISAMMPEVGTADMADWFAFAKVPKDEIKGCNNFKVNIG